MLRNNLVPKYKYYILIPILILSVILQYLFYRTCTLDFFYKQLRILSRTRVA